MRSSATARSTRRLLACGLLVLLGIPWSAPASARERGTGQAQLHVSVTVVATCAIETSALSDASDRARTIDVACRGAVPAVPQIHEVVLATADGLQRRTVATLNF